MKLKLSVDGNTSVYFRLMNNAHLTLLIIHVPASQGKMYNLISRLDSWMPNSANVCLMNGKSSNPDVFPVVIGFVCSAC